MINYTKKFIANICLLGGYLFISLGVFYGGAKFHVPWYGANDFSQYYQMTESPFQNNASAPFAYRVITPTVAHYIEKYNFFYDSKITPYKDHYLKIDGVTYNPSTLAALIFTNYLFFAFSAFFTAKTLQSFLKSTSLEMRMIEIGLPILIFMSFSTVVHGYAGLTEGGSILFVSILSYLYFKDSLFIFATFCFLSIFQRELVPLIMFFYLLGNPNFKKNSPYLIITIAAFFVYFLLKLIYPIPGYEEQTRPAFFFDNLLSFKITKDFLFQVVFANNIPFFVLFAAIVLKLKRIQPFVPYALVIVVLILLGVGTNIGNNIGRILNMTIPILIVCIANALVLSRDIKLPVVENSSL